MELDFTNIEFHGCFVMVAVSDVAFLNKKRSSGTQYW